MTPEQIVRKTNKLAREFYRLHGYNVPRATRFQNATHPQERAMWNLACLAFQVLLNTDPNDALSELDE